MNETDPAWTGATPTSTARTRRGPVTWPLVWGSETGSVRLKFAFAVLAACVVLLAAAAIAERSAGFAIGAVVFALALVMLRDLLRPRRADWSDEIAVMPIDPRTGRSPRSDRAGEVVSVAPATVIPVRQRPMMMRHATIALVEAAVAATLVATEVTVSVLLAVPMALLAVYSVVCAARLAVAPRAQSLALAPTGVWVNQLFASYFLAWDDIAAAAPLLLSNNPMIRLVPRHGVRPTYVPAVRWTLRPVTTRRYVQFVPGNFDIDPAVLLRALEYNIASPQVREDTARGGLITHLRQCHDEWKAGRP